MSQYQIAVVVGSLRKDSYNRQLAQAITQLAPADFGFVFVEIGDLPLYNQDDDANQADSVKRMKAEIAASQGVIFVTPEYNRSIPGVLKNALDHGSRPYGQNVWAGKPAGVIGASMGAIGTAMAQQHLRNIVAYLDMPTLNAPETYLKFDDQTVDTHHQFSNEGTRKFVQSWVDAYVAWVKKIAG